MLFPEPIGKPVHEPVYHFAVKPEGAEGLQVRVDTLPAQICEGLAVALVGGVTVALTVTVTLSQLLAPQVPSNLT